MPRPLAHIVTDKTVRAVIARAKRDGKRLRVALGGVPGLELRAHPDGTTSYVLRYRKNGGQVGVVLDAGYPALKLGEARGQANRLLRAVGVGADPWQAKRDAKAETERKRRAVERTLRSVAGLWLEAREAQEWRPRTRREFERIMRRNIFPVLGNRDPNDVTRGEVRKLLDDIADGKGDIGEGEKRRARTKPAKRESAHTLAVARLFYNWCHAERQEHLGITAHPCAGLEATALPPRQRTYSNDEIRAILAAVKDAELGDLVPMILHTGTRDEETRAMRWADIDLERKLWTIPGDATKNEQTHPVPLSDGALAILKRIRERKVSQLSPYVFPMPADSLLRVSAKRRKRDPNAPQYMERPNKALREVAIAAGLLRNFGTDERPEWQGEALRLHDIRRTVADRIKGEHGEAMMHAVLGHAEAKLTRTYGPTPRLKAIADALRWWSDQVAKLAAARKKSRASA